MQTYNFSLQINTFSLHDANIQVSEEYYDYYLTKLSRTHSLWRFASAIELANKRAVARQTYSFRQCEGWGLELKEPLESHPTKLSLMRSIWLPQELQRLIFYWHFRNEDYYYPDEEFFFPFLGGGPLGTTAGLTAGGRWLTRQQAADLDEEYDLGYAAERYTRVRLRRSPSSCGGDARYTHSDEEYHDYYEDDDGRCDYDSSDDEHPRSYYATYAGWDDNWDPEC